MAHDMAPLVETDADGFWDAVVENYGKYETEELLRHHFSFIGKVVKEFGDEIEMTFSVSIFSFDYTDEALRILPKVETRIRRELVDKIDEVYGRRYGEASSDAGERVEMRDGSQKRKGEESASAEKFRKETANQETASEERKELEKKVETLSERVRELEDEKEKLRRRLKEARETNEELREELERKDSESDSDSYNAEDWLG
jgi:vacuolar-type H+-ATPase subunit I/STV1